MPLCKSIWQNLKTSLKPLPPEHLCYAIRGRASWKKSTLAVFLSMEKLFSVKCCFSLLWLCQVWRNVWLVLFYQPTRMIWWHINSYLHAGFTTSIFLFSYYFNWKTIEVTNLWFSLSQFKLVDGCLFINIRKYW